MVASRRRSLPRRGVPLSNKIDLQDHGCGHARAHHSRVTWVPLSSMKAQKLSSDVASVGVTRPGGHGFCDVGRCWVRESRRLFSGGGDRAVLGEPGRSRWRGRVPKLQPGQTRKWTHADSTSGNMESPSVACGVADVSTDARVTYISVQGWRRMSRYDAGEMLNHTKIVITVTTPWDETRLGRR